MWRDRTHIYALIFYLLALSAHPLTRTQNTSFREVARGYSLSRAMAW